MVVVENTGGDACACWGEFRGVEYMKKLPHGAWSKVDESVGGHHGVGSKSNSVKVRRRDGQEDNDHQPAINF